MKIFPEPNLFKDPINWAKAVVGSKFKFWFSVFIQFLSGTFVLYASLKGTVGEPSLIFMVVVLFMIVFPFYYLYALRKLLLELQKREKT
jgi:hypothetical protein